MTIRSVYFNAADGIRLHAVDTGAKGTTIPLLCLPGLTRNHRDFEPVFETFSGTHRILAMDFRGRGLSAPAADPKTYRPDVEKADVIALLDHLNLERVAVLGTSRGGIVGMLMTNTNPDRIAGLCLNDMAPFLEPAALLRIKDYVGIASRFPSWDVAAEAIRSASVGFSGLSAAAWRSAARRIFVERDGEIVPDHDLRLALSLQDAAEIRAGKWSDLWALVPALASIPVSLLRGTGSDLVTRETAQAFKEMLPGLDWTEIADRGHVPMLDEPSSVAAIHRFLNRVDAKQQ